MSKEEFIEYYGLKEEPIEGDLLDGFTMFKGKIFDETRQNAIKKLLKQYDKFSIIKTIGA